MIRLLALAAIIATCVGCPGTSTQAGKQTIVADSEHGNEVESNAITRSMIGEWGTDGKAVLIVAESNGRVVFSAPENDTWRMEVDDAKIEGETVHFTQKHYLLSGEDHPFNGVACNSTTKLVDDDTLEFGMTTKATPEYAAEMLKRIE